MKRFALLIIALLVFIPFLNAQNKVTIGKNGVGTIVLGMAKSQLPSKLSKDLVRHDSPPFEENVFPYYNADNLSFEVFIHKNRVAGVHIFDKTLMMDNKIHVGMYLEELKKIEGVKPITKDDPRAHLYGIKNIYVYKDYKAIIEVYHESLSEPPWQGRLVVSAIRFD